MQLSSKIYVAGHRGLVGSAIYQELHKNGYTNVIGRSHAELDLMDAVAVRDFFDAEQPEYVILAAAFVGGIMANNTLRADFIYRNLAIQQNVIGESYRTGVKKLLFLGSTCIYPKDAPQPMREEMLLTSPLEYTNEPYAIAKIAGLKMCESFNLQYGTNFIACMPTNLYGPNDNFDLDHSHVLPAMLRKFHLAQLLTQGNWQALRYDLERRPLTLMSRYTELDERAIRTLLREYGITEHSVTLWGTGKPRREFLWSEDMATACVFLMKYIDFLALSKNSSPIRNCHVNIGTGQDISIADLALLIATEAGYSGQVHFDASKPDGTMRKLTDPSRLNDLGWRHTVDISEGIKRLYQWYCTH